MAEVIKPIEVSNMTIEHYDDAVSLQITNGKYKGYGVVCDTLSNALDHLHHQISYAETKEKLNKL